MAILSAGLARVFAIFSPSESNKADECCMRMKSTRPLPPRTEKTQYASADPMLATPPSEVKPKAILATTQPAAQDATMRVPGGELGAEKPVLTMRGGIDHGHHGTRMSHDICCCLICCECMDDCCTAFDDVICCE